MPKNYQEMTKDITAYMTELRKEVPEAMGGFASLAQGATIDGALSKKVKEFAALAIAVTQKCDGCIGFHTKTLKDLGATRSEVAEVLAVCIYMGGGPALMYAADALRAFDDLDK